MLSMHKLNRALLRLGEAIPGLRDCRLEQDACSMFSRVELMCGCCQAVSQHPESEAWFCLHGLLLCVLVCIMKLEWGRGGELHTARSF